MRHIALTAGFLLYATAFCAQQIDTARVYTIPEVVVRDRYQTREIRSTSPLQLYTREDLQRMNALQVSDAVKHFAGVTVKDYGGIGGLKTISVRSLGAQHTAVGYDGIAVTDCQTGQIDIGRFSLERVDQIALSNGQNDQIFQPARLYAAAGLLNIQTLTPTFDAGKPTNLAVSLKTGSWGLANPALSVEQKLSDQWTVSANGEWMSAKGDYPYTLHYGGEDDLTSRERRKNTEVQTLRTEAALYGNRTEEEQIRLKAYYYQSSRGLPGATTLYYDYASQHLWDRNAFVQGSYKRELSDKWVVQTAAKWNWNYQRYQDPDYKNEAGETENNYYQQEYYLTASALYRAFDHLSFNLSTDGSINRMQADLTDFAQPVRYTWLTVLAGKYVNEWMTATASALLTVVDEQARLGNSAGNHRKVSPYVSLSVKPFATEDFRIRFFYKDIFRLPSFNDLYYGQTGNIRLKPENARQANIGLAYSRKISEALPYLSLTVDGYANRVTDKIVATPTKNLFVWSMVNLGKVDIKGVDIAGDVHIRPYRGYLLRLSGSYTYQRALDVTSQEPGSIESLTYGHQIAYTPRIAGSGQIVLETPWADLTYNMVFSGKRYVLGQNIAENRLPGYADHSLGIARDFRWAKTRWNAGVEVLNLTGKNYEIVKNFPMPGRSFRLNLSFDY